VGLVCPDSVAHVEEDDSDEGDIEDETNEYVCSFEVSFFSYFIDCTWVVKADVSMHT
jgi:hypothetical protein